MLGEIIQTSTLDFLAESFTLHQPPPLGELVKAKTVCPLGIEGETYCYGVVCYGTTSSPDVGRRAIRRSSGGVVDELVYRAHPQLERLLQTVFRVLLVGWRDGDKFRQTLPPLPPPLHYTVYECESGRLDAPQEGEMQRFCNKMTYFRLLLGASCETPSEQVLAAHIRRVYMSYQNPPQASQWLARAARECAILLKNDHDRLMALLSAIDPN